MLVKGETTGRERASVQDDATLVAALGYFGTTRVISVTLTA